MKLRPRKICSFYFVLAVTLVLPAAVLADPGRYPQFAQQQLPPNLVPEFIHLDEFVDEILQRKRLLIVDVRSRQEYEEAHIEGSISLPLDEVSRNLSMISKDRLVVLY